MVLLLQVIARIPDEDGDHYASGDRVSKKWQQSADSGGYPGRPHPDRGLGLTDEGGELVIKGALVVDVGDLDVSAEHLG